MATTTDHRVAPAIARDGVDTRPEGEQDLTTSVEAVHVRGGQTAALCGAVTKAGRACTCKARQGFATCGRHKNVVVANLVGMCGERKTDGTYCQKARAEGDTICGYHRKVADRRKEREEQRTRSAALRDEVLDLLWDEGNIVRTFAEASVPITDAYDRGWITRDTETRLLFWARIEWNWYRQARVVPTAGAKTDLARLALDNQNVHTKEVNRLMSDGMELLLKTPVPKAPRTFADLADTWADKPLAVRRMVLLDMWKWYSKSTCVTENDWLYQRMLDGLWVRIREHKERAQLTQRLWEEASESVDTCCQGHLSRLTNVLVGFLEEVKPDVPVGQLLQEKMAAIAGKDISVEEKVEQARAVLEELKVPAEEHGAWLEAF